MLLANIDDTPYKIVLFLHIITMFIAFSPMFVHPFIDADSAGTTARTTLFEGIARRAMRIYGGGLIAGGLFGFALAGMSDDGTGELTYSMGDTWLALSALVWIAMNGVLHAMIIPGEKAIAAGDDSGSSKSQLGGMIMTALFLVVIYLMVFKPGA